MNLTANKHLFISQWQNHSTKPAINMVMGV